MSQNTKTFQRSFEDLIKSEQFAHKVLNASLNGLYIHDVKLGQNIFVNSQYTKLTGYTLADLQKMDKAQFFALFHKDDQERVAQHMEKIVNNIVDELEIEYRFKTKSGRWIWCLSRDSIFERNEDGSASQFIGTFFDITKNKQFEEERLKSEWLYRALAINLPNGAAFVVDHDLKYVVAEGQALRDVEMNPSDFEGKTIYEALDPELASLYEPHYRSALNGKSFNMEHFSHGRYYLTSGTPLYDAEGKIYAALAVSFDITEKKHSEIALRESETRFRNLFETLTQGVAFQAPPDGAIVDVNTAAEKLLGLSREELIGRKPKEPAWQLVNENGSQHNIEENPAFVALSTGKTIRDTVLGIYNPRLKEHRWLHVDAIPQFKSGEYKPHTVCVLFTDITKRKQIEDVLRENEEKFSKAFYSSPSLIFICELETGIFIDVNDAYCALTGYNRDEMVGRSSIELGLITKKRRKGILQRIRKFGRLQRLELKIASKTGAIRHCLFAAETIEYRGKKCLVYSGIDITEREKAEQALRESEGRFRAMADGLPLVIWVHNAEGKQLFVNKTFNEFFGVSATESDCECWQLLVHPEDEKTYVEEFLTSVRERRPFHAKARVRRADGKWRWIESWGRQWFSESGEHLGIIGTSADITERIKADELLRGYHKTLERDVKKKTGKILEQYQQLERMNLFTKKMAEHTIKAMENDRRMLSKEIHDSIGGGLAAIKMLLETRIQHLDQPLPEDITSTEKIIDHLKNMIRESKRISHQMRPMALDDLGLTAAISETIKKFNEFYPKIQVEHTLRLLDDETTEEIKIVLYRVIQEALNNIGKHSGADSVKISLNESQGLVSLKIQDNGCGFNVSNNLDVNMSLQGYGLHSMQERVKICKGHFQVESSSGKGTCIIATIPKCL